MLKHEHAIISRMVQLGSVRRYDHLLRPEYFTGFNADVYKILREYESTYGVCMDTPTFREQLPDFDWIESDVQVEWYADELAQDFVKAQVEKIINDAREVLEENPKQVTRDLQNKLLELAPHIGDAISGRINLLEHGRERLRMLQSRRIGADQKLAGITTGFRLLDEISHGTQPGEIEFYVGRPGSGKSFILLYSCYKAWLEQGKRVSFISPEMTAFEMGVRFDSMHQHVSSMLMQSGRMTDFEMEQYSDAIEAALEKARNDIIFRDSTQLGRKFTTADVRRIIEEDKPDLLALDGILLIEPVAKYRDTRTRVTNITEELKAICVQTEVPMRLAHQVNRESEQRTSRTTKTKVQKRSPTDGIPFLSELAESGSTEQYANRVYAMRLEGGRLWLAVRKNRNGPEGRYISAIMDIDTGTVSDEKPEDPDNPTDTSVAVQQGLPLPKVPAPSSDDNDTKWDNVF